MPNTPRPKTATRTLLTLALALCASSPALAQPWHDHGGAQWGAGWDTHPAPFAGDDAREGKVVTERFPAPDAAPLLGHGMISVTTPDARPDGDTPPPEAAPPEAALPGAPPIAPGTLAGPAYDPDTIPRRISAIYEAAVIDGLIKVGYDTTTPPPTSAHPAPTQVAELHITRSILVPAERRRSPFSGEMAMGASNHGSMLGLGLNIDLSKPRAALIGTTLALRIRDATTGKPLWEGRASIATREGAARWGEPAIAARLASALLDGLNTAPTPTGPTPTALPNKAAGTGH